MGSKFGGRHRGTMKYAEGKRPGETMDEFGRHITRKVERQRSQFWLVNIPLFVVLATVVLFILMVLFSG